MAAIMWFSVVCFFVEVWKLFMLVNVNDSAEKKQSGLLT